MAEQVALIMSIPTCPDCAKSLNERMVDFSQPYVDATPGRINFETHGTYRLWCVCGYSRLVHDGDVIEEWRSLSGNRPDEFSAKYRYYSESIRQNDASTKEGRGTHGDV